MFVYICICVMHMFVYTQMHICVWGYIHACVYMCVCMWVHMYTSIYACLYAHTPVNIIYACICTPICESVYIHIYLNLFTHLISALNTWVLFIVFLENSPDIYYSSRGLQTNTTPSPYRVAWTLVLTTLSHCLCTFHSGIPGRIWRVSKAKGELQRKYWKVYDLESDCSQQQKPAQKPLIWIENFQCECSKNQVWFLTQETMLFTRRHGINSTLSAGTMIPVTTPMHTYKHTLIHTYIHIHTCTYIYIYFILQHTLL